MITTTVALTCVAWVLSWRWLRRRFPSESLMAFIAAASVMGALFVTNSL